MTPKATILQGDWPPPNVDWFYHDEWTAIAHGDCREILPRLPKVDLVLTDPPYGIGFAAQPTVYQRKKGMRPSDWDSSAPSESDIQSVIGAGSKQIIWGGNYFGLPPARCVLSWIKPDAPPSMGATEYAWTNLNQNSKYIIQSISATNAERVGHPTQKPLAVITFSCLQAGDWGTLVDPYLGSGTALVAAKQLGRRAIGIEIERKYCEIAAKRLQQEYLPLTVPLVAPTQEGLI